MIQKEVDLTPEALVGGHSQIGDYINLDQRLADARVEHAELTLQKKEWPVIAEFLEPFEPEKRRELLHLAEAGRTAISQHFEIPRGLIRSIVATESSGFVDTSQMALMLISYYGLKGRVKRTLDIEGTTYSTGRGMSSGLYKQFKSNSARGLYAGVLNANLSPEEAQAEADVRRGNLWLRSNPEGFRPVVVLAQHETEY